MKVKKTYEIFFSSASLARCARSLGRAESVWVMISSGCAEAQGWDVSYRDLKVLLVEGGSRRSGRGSTFQNVRSEVESEIVFRVGAGGCPWVEWVRNVGQLGMRGGSGAERVRVGVYGAWERRNSKYGEV